MSSKEKKVKEPRLEVYLSRSILSDEVGETHCFEEGAPTREAKDRLEKIRKSLGDNFLTGIITECRSPSYISDRIDDAHIELITKLVESVTSEVGRALVGLTVLQLCVKSIAPDQSIRLHKAGAGGSNFSWTEGVPMRVLDTNYITPILRSHNLLKLNADGFMMTRSLAENYPYSKLYKAAIRGARREWLEIVDLVEAQIIAPKPALKLLISMLINRSDTFKKTAEAAVQAVKLAARKMKSLEQAIDFMETYIHDSPYSARVFEVAMHSFFQVLEDEKVFGGYLKPLSQMRSANKKHGNIGDVEIIEKPRGLQILEAWDGKYGKNDLRDELEELNEKLESHPETELVGFVIDGSVKLKSDVKARISELEEIHGVEIRVASFRGWITEQASRLPENVENLHSRWLTAFTESLGQMRRERAPIDEPSDAWLEKLIAHSGSWK